jgi:hypothetical protein
MWGKVFRGCRLALSQVSVGDPTITDRKREGGVMTMNLKGVDGGDKGFRTRESTRPR